MLRLLSNHGGSANLFFFVSLLYFLLWWLERQSSNNSLKLFNHIRILPLYFMLFYTMGFPGWEKIMNSAQVMGRYINLFSNSFLSKLPGGINPFIYFLGLMELSVPILLVVSLIKSEFSLKKYPFYLILAIYITIITFVMLCFGLSVILNFPGATNLVFYSIFTLGLYYYVVANLRTN
ncbi:hypothetical protein SAMN06265379_103204 [Saccharicrinis carchari]|uniref:DoxX protein n=1 Tax=Saccharicrinis carchari TaxID=1168039 RepID=A0A521CLA2_SACCC|nr:hypothetical protein SAMN06265379_103204 [Saccharicrinis carchari]